MQGCQSRNACKSDGGFHFLRMGFQYLHNNLGNTRGANPDIGAAGVQ
jgi:hypothetical protein